MMKKLGLYIHIPFCKRKCAYCDFVSYPDSEHLFVRYIDALLAEARFYSGFLKNHTIDTVFIGGGTPPLLPYALIGKLVDGLKDISDWQPGEFSIEANPETLTETAVSAYADMGIDRLSIGLQTHDDVILKRIGRRHDYQTFLKAYEAAKKHIGSINVDLMFGLPGQSVEAFQETLRRIIGLQPQHVSAYALKLEDDTPLAGWYRGADDELDRQMYHDAADMLIQAGYTHYETSNFAKPGFECAHNLKYWSGGQYLGLGASAHSYVADDDLTRFSNTEYLEEYLAKVAAGQKPVAQTGVLSTEEMIDEYVMLRLRLSDGIEFADYKTQFGRDFAVDNSESIIWAENNGLITQNSGYIRPTRRGFDLQNTLIQKFMKKL